MVSKDKLKKGIAGALLLGGAATVTIVLIMKRSGKDDSATTRQQTKELKDDLCVTLLAEYVKAGESGMAKEELKALYAKGFAQCPAVFLPLQQQDELPKLEAVRVQLAKKQEEQKAAEGGVNTVEKRNKGINPVGQVKPSGRKVMRLAQVSLQLFPWRPRIILTPILRSIMTNLLIRPKGRESLGTT